jgi:hypothetical protein
MLRAKIVAALSACLVIVSCSGTGTAPEEGKTVDELLAEKNLRIVEELNTLIAFDIHSWIYINRENVVLRDGPSRHYLVELNAPCYNLQFAQRIAFTSFGRTLRNTDFIAVTDGPGTVERCFMKTFYTLEKIEK